MLTLYKTIMGVSTPFLNRLLARRALAGKEDRSRLAERSGHAPCFRSKGKVIWIHAASVGEAQSTLTLIDALLLRNPDLHILVTTGTVSSAALLQKRLPPRAMHQFYPLDHPEWVKSFLNHWHPDLVLWMESEIWPSMLSEIKARHIPAVLLNGRLSRRSFRRWKLARHFIAGLLSAFNMILTQTKEDSDHFKSLGAENLHVTDNLKYSAAPLPCDPDMLAGLQRSLEGRILWLYASTHEGEEEIACRVHKHLQSRIPDLLTVIVPRHPDRREAVQEVAAHHQLSACLRSSGALPSKQDSLYIADTLGELGLFYRLCPVACIGRSLSLDGGGGHNPIEAAMLGCAVLHGPNIQNLAQIYGDMDAKGAATLIADESALAKILGEILAQPLLLKDLQQKALRFASDKEKILQDILLLLEPYLARLDPHSVRACA